MANNNSRRVLLVRNPAFHDFGGGERFPVNLGHELEKHGYEPVVISRSPKVLHYAKSQGLHTIRGWWWQQQDWSGKRALLFPIYLCWQLILFLWYLQLILRRKPTTIHLQSKDDFIAGTFAGRLLGKRVVWTDHADLKYIFANHTIWYKNPIGKLVYLASKFAHAITLVSQSEETAIIANFGHPAPSNFTVIHNGVPDEQVSPIKLSKTGITFCATSRLVTAKGIGELITAFQKIHSENPDTTLWLVGDGPEREKFRAQAASEPAIVFLGHSDEPLRYVAACDIFVHPSYHEGFSLSLVEAAMLGKPIVACNVGGNPEIIENNKNGLLVHEKSADELHSALQTLLNNAELRKTYSKNARESFAKEFDWSKIVRERFIPLYEKH